ncbi:MAG TPA: phosphate ABC transporter substrate-binding protein PstS [Stellaceae bacterium]|jgi:phosphate transport system substrate-binding protein|nr:phosphate ABC transporter substrate-binding protein PstS [Stellaceae bacterium]
MTVLVSGTATMALMGAAHATDISGAGSTFIYPVFSKWADAYHTKTGVGMNYQSIGSGGGIKQIESKTVDFGATDKPLEAAELDKYGMIQFPMIMGGIVPVVNIPGIKAGQMKLTGELLADIYLGNITNWNDPKIAAVNPGLKLPNLAIATVYRSDGSGTTYNFTYYLCEMSPEFKSKVGSDTAVQFPVGLGGKGNEGVSAFTSRTSGAIGYVEYAYALQNKLVYADMKNHDGNFVEPTFANFAAAAANADWVHAPNFKLILANQPGANSWPMTASTFVLFYKKQDKPDVAKTAMKFFDYSLKQGQDMAKSLGYIPLPTNVVQLIESNWSKDVKDASGKPLWP